MTNSCDESAPLTPELRTLLEEAVRRGLIPHEVTSSRRSAFADRYYRDPSLFVRECFYWQSGEGPTAYQEETMEALVKSRRVCERGPHGLGKTAKAAWIVLWFVLTRESRGVDWKAVTTASAWRQLTKYLWPEIHKWARRLNWEHIGWRGPFNMRTELQTLDLKLEHGAAFAVASDQPELIEGAHADSLLYLFDEAKAIPDATFDAAEGAFSGAGGDTGQEAFAIAISTPGEPQGRFYDIHRRRPGFGDWTVRHVTLEQSMAAGRVSQEWADNRRQQWGENSALYLNRVKGEFASSDEDGIISLSWVEAANERWLAWKESDPVQSLTAVGVDVGTTGDKTVMALRFGSSVDSLRYHAKEDTMETAGRVYGLLTANAGACAIVDVIGIGAGVVHRLREQGASVLAFNASERAAGKDGKEMKDKSGELGFLNKRAAAWWHMREMLDPASRQNIALPPDDTLTGDLTAPHYKVVSGGKIQVESKADIRARLHRSTDAADAVIQSFFEEPAAPAAEECAPMQQFNYLGQPWPKSQGRSTVRRRYASSPGAPAWKRDRY